MVTRTVTKLQLQLWTYPVPSIEVMVHLDFLVMQQGALYELDRNILDTVDDKIYQVKVKSSKLHNEEILNIIADARYVLPCQDFTNTPIPLHGIY